MHRRCCMKHKILVVLTVLVLASLLGGCQERNTPPYWSVAGEGDSCTTGTIIDRRWSDYNDQFYLLIKTVDGEIGQARVTAHVYSDLQLGDTTCVVR